MEDSVPVQAPEAGALLTLIAREWEDASVYHALSQVLPGEKGLLLQRLCREEQRQARCLQGIYTLVTGTQPTIHTPPPKGERVETTLRRCYGREMQDLAAYEARSGHREYGPVFARLARQDQDHCRILLEILGSTGNAR